MAQLARLEFTIQDASGNAVTGASIEVRRQGAQVFGAHVGSVTTINVDSPGAVEAGDTVAINTGSTTRNVSSITATTVVVGGLGFSSPQDDDRITITAALPAINEDAEGATSKPNPLTTDANGYANCFIAGGKYDVLISGGGQATRLLQDVAAVGGETNRSTVFMSGSAVAWIWDTLRTAAAGDTLAVLRNAGNDRFKVQGDGEIQAGAAGATHSLTGTLTTSGALTVTAGGATVTAGGVTVTAGDIAATASLANFKRLGATGGTAVVAGDFSLGAAWGSTASVSVQAGSNDTRGRITITSAGVGQAANPSGSLTFKDGTYTTTPQCIVSSGQGFSVLTTGDFWYADCSTLNLQFIYGGTPVAGRLYEMHWLVIK